MRFAVSKHWLKADLQKMVWQYSFETPSAKVMKGVTIENVPRKWPAKKLTTEKGVHAKVAMGRPIKNPCLQCEMAENYCSDRYCGECKSRPTVMPALFEDSYLGGVMSQCKGGDSPRTGYMKKLNRQTCPQCKTIYRHDFFAQELIAEEGVCQNCESSRSSPSSGPGWLD